MSDTERVKAATGKAARKVSKTNARSDQAPNRMAGKFTKGQSGNPDGRPKGIEDKRVALRSLLEPHAVKLVAKVVELAKEGDTTALRICIDRLIPALKARDAPFTLAAASGSLADQGKAVTKALFGGDLTPDEAVTAIGVLAAQARIVEVDELTRRVGELEERIEVEKRNAKVN